MLVDGEGDEGRDTIYWQLMEEGLLDAIQPDMLHIGFWPFHVLARDMLVEIPHPTLDMLKLTGIPIKFSQTKGSIERHPPLLGEHTREILLEIGYSTDDLEALEQAEVI